MQDNSILYLMYPLNSFMLCLSGICFLLMLNVLCVIHVICIVSCIHVCSSMKVQYFNICSFQLKLVCLEFQNNKDNRHFTVFVGMSHHVLMNSFNCRGLRDKNKRTQVFSWLKKKFKGVVLLQETHSINSDKNIGRMSGVTVFIFRMALH